MHIENYESLEGVPWRASEVGLVPRETDGKKERRLKIPVSGKERGGSEIRTFRLAGHFEDI